jgi:crotonobetainyl-CoA:carnitine CoA-transferase CaiB-like acyl-CoA transferase
MTGKPSVVDVSLMSIGLWQLQPDLTHAKLVDGHAAKYDRKATWNPITGAYRTRDGRFIHLNMMDADRYWANFCEVIGRPELIDDPRFLDMPLRKQNARECVETLDETFASRDFAEWCEILSALEGVWAPMRTPREVHEDPQVRANGFLADVEMGNGSKLTLVTSPAQFDEEAGEPTRAPELGEHTEQVLLDLGLTWDEISALKDRAVIG